MPRCEEGRSAAGAVSGDEACQSGLPTPPAAGAAAAAYAPAMLRTLQKNVAKIEGNLEKLEERLAHEKEKFQEYDVVLKQHEER